jgi:hypothetical protein
MCTRGAGDQHGGALQARRRVLAGVGDLARQGQAGGAAPRSPCAIAPASCCGAASPTPMAWRASAGAAGVPLQAAATATSSARAAATISPSPCPTGRRDRNLALQPADRAARFEDSRIAATVFDRTLLRAGETVHMKHFLRRHTQQGGRLRAWCGRPGTRTRRAPGQGLHHPPGQRREDRIGAGAGMRQRQCRANGRFRGRQAGRVRGDDRRPGVAGRFRVEQFRVPTMKAVLQGPKAPAGAPQQLSRSMRRSAICPAARRGQAPVKLRTWCRTPACSFGDYEGLHLQAGAT